MGFPHPVVPARPGTDMNGPHPVATECRHPRRCARYAQSVSSEYRKNRSSKPPTWSEPRPKHEDRADDEPGTSSKRTEPHGFEPGMQRGRKYPLDLRRAPGLIHLLGPHARQICGRMQRWRSRSIWSLGFVHRDSGAGRPRRGSAGPRERGSPPSRIRCCRRNPDTARPSPCRVPRSRGATSCRRP